MPPKHRLLIALGGLFAAGCGPSTPASCVLGTGRVSFVDIQPGDAVSVVLGSQGLYYIPGSVLVRGVDFHNVALHYTVSFDGGALINATDEIVDLQPLDLTTLPTANPRRCASTPLTTDAADSASDGGAPLRTEFCLPGGLDKWGVVIGRFVLLRNDLYKAIIGSTLRMRVDGTDANGRSPFSDEHTFVATAKQP